MREKKEEGQTIVRGGGIKPTTSVKADISIMDVSISLYPYQIYPLSLYPEWMYPKKIYLRYIQFCFDISIVDISMDIRYIHAI